MSDTPISPSAVSSKTNRSMSKKGPKLLSTQNKPLNFSRTSPRSKSLNSRFKLKKLNRRGIKQLNSSNFLRDSTTVNQVSPEPILNFSHPRENLVIRPMLLSGKSKSSSG
jgi:hypothetical protein